LTPLFYFNSYQVEFSTPKLTKPIPEGTVKVIFNVMEVADGEHEIEFNFENESLKHKIGNTMRANMYEVSLTITFTYHIKIDLYIEMGKQCLGEEA